ncbi:MAG: TIGR00266 family protein [Polyangiales bacterium]
MSTVDFAVLQQPDFALLRVKLDPGQRFYAEPSAMATMDPTIQLKSGFKGGLVGSLGRAFSGESMIMNTFTAQRGSGEIMFAPGAAGDVIHHSLRGGNLMLQRGAYLAHGEGIDINAAWGGARGFFSGQGLILLRAQGTGDVFFSTYGAVLELDVASEGLIVDTGYIAAFEDTLSYQVSVLPGLGLGGRAKAFFFGGEGLVVQFSGQGKVWVQTRTVNPFLSWVYPYRPVKQRE